MLSLSHPRIQSRLNNKGSEYEKDFFSSLCLVLIRSCVCMFVRMSVYPPLNAGVMLREWLFRWVNVEKRKKWQGTLMLPCNRKTKRKNKNKKIDKNKNEKISRGFISLGFHRIFIKPTKVGKKYTLKNLQSKTMQK